MCEAPAPAVLSEQLLRYRVSVAPTQGSQPYPIVIDIEQTLRDQFVDLMIPFRGRDGFSWDTTEKPQAEHQSITLAV